MRFPREFFTVRELMCVIVLLALIMTVIVQTAQLRSGRVREEQLRASLAEAETRAAWVSSINEWHQVGDSPALNKRRADGVRRAKEPLARW